jgi:hypothetical protein
VTAKIEGKPTMVGIASCVPGAAIMQFMQAGRRGRPRIQAWHWDNMTRKEIIRRLWPNVPAFCLEWVYLTRSGTITSYLYQPKARVLFLCFRQGLSYLYLAVPARKVKEFQRSRHKGAYVNRHIKGAHQCLHLW